MQQPSGDLHRQPLNHRLNAIGDLFQVGIHIGQFAWGLEDIEVAVERNLAADFGFLAVDLGVGRVRQHFHRAALHPHAIWRWFKPLNAPLAIPPHPTKVP